MKKFKNNEPKNKKITLNNYDNIIMRKKDELKKI